MRFPPHDPQDSGAHDFIGYRIDLTAEDGSSRVSLQMRPELANRNGTMHGGIHAVVLDAAGGYAASRWLAGSDPELARVVTLSLTTSYLLPVTEGEVIATGVVSGGGRKIVYADVELRNGAGQLCSKASGVFKKVSQ